MKKSGKKVDGVPYGAPIIQVMNLPWVELFVRYDYLAKAAGYVDVKDAVQKMNATFMTLDTFESMLQARV